MACFVAGAGVATARTLPPQPDISPPPPERSPFSGSEAFCSEATETDQEPKGEPTTTTPGITPTAVQATLLIAPDAAAPTVPPVDPVARAEHFAQLANGCGGIHGRRLEVETVVLTGDAARDCAAISRTGTPAVVMVAGSLPPLPCLLPDHGLVVAPEGSATNALLATTHGRLFVGDSPEGALDAQVQDLVEHANLGTSRFAVLTTGSTNPSFAKALDAALAARNLRPVGVAASVPAGSPQPDTASIVARLARAKVSAIVTDGIDTELLSRLATLPSPPAVYVLAPAPGTETSVPLLDSRATRNVAVETWADPHAVATARSLGPGGFAQRCEEWAAAVPAGATTTTSTSTTRPAPPTTTVPRGSDSSLTSICLAMRVLLRGLYMAGAQPTTSDVVRAFHNLPFTDQPGVDGWPTTRPNQLINEPVHRAAQVVVRSRLTDPCPAGSDAATSRSRAKAAGLRSGACWLPLDGYDEGGRAVNTPLTSASPP
jgi:hypothetical protein